MDCSKTINFLHELKRLCDTRDECVANAANKEDCPMFGVCKLTDSKICANDAKKAIKTVQKWSDEHPVKTYVQDFFEKFPISTTRVLTENTVGYLDELSSMSSIKYENLK